MRARGLWRAAGAVEVRCVAVAVAVAGCGCGLAGEAVDEQCGALDQGGILFEIDGFAGTVCAFAGCAEAVDTIEIVCDI